MHFVICDKDLLAIKLTLNDLCVRTGFFSLLYFVFFCSCRRQWWLKEKQQHEEKTPCSSHTSLRDSGEALPGLSLPRRLGLGLGFGFGFGFSYTSLWYPTKGPDLMTLLARLKRPTCPACRPACAKNGIKDSIPTKGVWEHTLPFVCSGFIIVKNGIMALGNGLTEGKTHVQDLIALLEF